MKSTKPLVIIFGRFPQIGVGKTRLAADIGTYKTWRFYHTNLAKSLRDLKDRRWQLAFCATPDGVGGLKSYQGCRLRKQGRGTLGQRLVRQMRRNRRGPTLIIGSDVPDLSPNEIRKAMQILYKSRAVLGPSSDGGFWCIGLRGQTPSPRLFDNIPWSSADTMAVTRRRLEQSAFPTGLTTALDDIDNLAALMRWKSRQGSGNTFREPVDGHQK